MTGPRFPQQRFEDRPLDPPEAFDPPDAFAEGVEAYECGEYPHDCPYPAGSGERALWLDGWHAAGGGRW